MNKQFLTRQDTLRSYLQQAELDALLVFGYENIRYITGFSGHAAYVIMTQAALYLVTDYRYAEQAQNECHNTQVICRDRDNETLGHCINRLLPASSKLGFEASNISVAMWQGIATELSASSLKPVDAVIEQMRMVKDDWEVKQIQLAAAIADQALNEVLPYFSTGVTERDVALELEYRMQKLGSEGLSFDTIMLFGERTSLPHGVPSTQALKVGDFITLDFGAVVNGYRSDMTRSYLYGDATQKQRDIYQTVADAQAAAMAEVRANVPAINSFNASRRILNDSPFAQYAGEGLGHGVGLFLHEHPFIKPGCDYVLTAGNVITIEPGIYIPNFGGVRLEEDILVTENGYQLLTHAAKPMILPERN
jgi:Xaa-Pro aminopeptidase